MILRKISDICFCLVPSSPCSCRDRGTDEADAVEAAAVEVSEAAVEAAEVTTAADFAVDSGEDSEAVSVEVIERSKRRMACSLTITAI